MTKCPADRLTREYLKKQGYSVDKAESYNAIVKRKKDLFRFIDFVGIHPTKKELLAIQTTSKSNLSARIKKAENLKDFWNWLGTGNPVVFHGWYKNRNRWEVKEVRYEGTSDESGLF